LARRTAHLQFLTWSPAPDSCATSLPPSDFMNHLQVYSSSDPAYDQFHWPMMKSTFTRNSKWPAKPAYSAFYFEELFPSDGKYEKLKENRKNRQILKFSDLRL
jgi:hypothetical protein